MSDVTNYDGRLEAMAAYSEAMYINIAKVNNAYHDSVENVYLKTLPSKYLDFFGIKKLGGKTLLMNQLVEEENTTNWAAYSSTLVSLSESDGALTATVVNTSSPNNYAYGVLLQAGHKFDVIAGHKYLVNYSIKSNLAGSFSGEFANNYSEAAVTVEADVWTTKQAILTAGSSRTSAFLVYSTIADKTGLVYELKNAMLIDLTLAFGAGNEPSTVTEFNNIFTSDYYAFSTGNLISAGVTSIISKDSDDTQILDYLIPDEVQALLGYGLSCPSHYNYIDFENKKFVQEVGSRAYEAGDESDSTVITDGTNTNYVLSPAVETDISAYITEDNIVDAEIGGSLTFSNQHVDDYKIPVPVELEYIGVT